MNYSQLLYLMNEQNIEKKWLMNLIHFLSMLVQIYYIMKTKAGHVKAESCNPFFKLKLVRLKLFPLSLN